ncbi:autotransporter outer membrane beta-barrel domain-containing protein [Candidatus Tisiphia endosymbiont of Sialis lutaria]|uniref:autotransporter outer membrane beta-barrel domain-containing protein n=1 Tax=Candidatus Tisiphia endosymbiont of Sialis lutaria TaxID=2029164 RepID=UPI00312C9A6B
MVIFSMLQNYFVNKYLVKKYLVFVFLFFLLQKFDVSDVLAVGFNEEIGQFSHPLPITYIQHLQNEREATWSAINKVSDELTKLEQKSSQKIKLLNDPKNLKEEINSLEIEYSALLDRQNKYKLEKQKSEEMLLTLPQPEIKYLSLYSKEIAPKSIDEFTKNMETIWNIINDAHNKLTALDTTNLTIIKPLKDENKFTEMLHFLEDSSVELLTLKQRCASEEIAQELSDTLQEKKENLSVQLQEMQEDFFDKFEEEREIFSVKLKVANEQLKNLQKNISDIEEKTPLLQQKIDEHDQLLISIDKKENKIAELKETRNDLEAKLRVLDDKISSLLLAQSERRNIPNEFEEFASVENDKQVKPNKAVQHLKDEGYASLDNLAIRDTPSPTITESNQTAPQQISRKRKRVDSEDESLDDIPPITRNSLSLRDELETAEKGIAGHDNAAIALITETSPVMERDTDMPPVTKMVTVTVTSPITQKATVMATPVIHIAPIIEEVSVMEIATTTDMPPAAKMATVTLTSPVTQKATVMADPVIHMAPITEEAPVMEIATITDTPPVTKTATVDAHPTLVSEHTNTVNTQSADTQTVATQTDIVDEQQTSVAIQTDVAAEKPVHAVIQQAAVSVHDNADVDPYEIFEDSLGLETLFAEEEPIAAEPTAPVDDPPSSVVKQPDQADEQPTLVAKQANSETEQINLESEQSDSSTEQTNLKSEQSDSVAIPSSQTLVEENSYISPINPDVEQDISKYTTYIEFDYLDTISNALTNHTLTDNSTVNVVASGDNDYIKKGGWIQFISSITKQQQQGNILAFKNNQQGFILGFDARPLDSFIIGIAYALANSYTKLQTIFNDKQNTILHVAAIYTQHTLSPNIYLNSYLKYGKAFIKNKGERNNIAINSETNGYITRAKLETYYKMNLDKFLFKPIVGIIFDHFLINNFTEYRKEFNINVPTKKGKRILLETGISLSKNILVENISIIPEIHVKLDNTLLLNNPTGIITFTNTSHQAPIVVPIIKPVGSSAKNVKYTLGGYVNVQSVLPFKLGAGYDYSFKKDLITHSFYFNGLIKF